MVYVYMQAWREGTGAEEKESRHVDIQCRCRGENMCILGGRRGDIKDMEGGRADVRVGRGGRDNREGIQHKRRERNNCRRRDQGKGGNGRGGTMNIGRRGERTHTHIEMGIGNMYMEIQRGQRRDSLKKTRKESEDMSLTSISTCPISFPFLSACLLPFPPYTYMYICTFCICISPYPLLNLHISFFSPLPPLYIFYVP